MLSVIIKRIKEKSERRKSVKKLRYIALMGLLSTSMAFTAVAEPGDVEETAQIEESVQIEEEYSEEEYSEQETLTPEENGMIDKTEKLFEEDEEIEEGEEEYTSEQNEENAEGSQPEEENSRNQTLETVAVLTDEQVKAGYKMIDGKVYSPGELSDAQKNSGIHYGGVMPSSDTGIVAFVAVLPEGIHDDVYVTVIDVNTYKTYQTVLYESNKLASTISLPDGNYILSKCGLTTDTEGRFFTESRRFTVNRGMYSVVNLDVLDNQAGFKTESQKAIENDPAAETVTGNVEEVDTSDYDKVSDALNFNPSEKIAESLPEKKGIGIGNIIFLLICLGIPGYVLVRLIIKNNQRGDEF